MSFKLQSCNNFREQSIPFIQIILNQTKYLINVPDLSQRFLSEYNIKLDSNSKLIISGETCDHFSGIFGLLTAFYIRNAQNNTQIFCTQNVFNYFNQLKYLFGFKGLYYSLYSLMKDNQFQHVFGISNQLLQEYKTSMNYIQLIEILKNPDQSILKYLNSSLESVNYESKYFSQEIVQLNQLRIIKNGINEIILIPNIYGSSQLKNFQILIIINQSKVHLSKFKLAQYNLQSQDIKKLVQEQQIQINNQIFSLSYFQEFIQQNPVAYLILDIHNNDQLQFLNSNMLNQITGQNQNQFQLQKVFHISKCDLVFSQVYLQWLKFTSNEVQHIFLNSDFDEQFGINNKIQLNYYIYYDIINKYLYPFFPKNQHQHQNNNYNLQLQNIKFEFHQNFTVYDLAKPNTKNKIVLKNDFQNIEKLIQEQSQQLQLNVTLTQNQFKTFPFFIILGTGSMLPTSYRNVASILMGINSETFCLLDAGEGGYFQLSHQFGSQINQVISKIKLIIITHIHGDHLFGIFKMIESISYAYQNKNNERLFIIIPQNCLQCIYNFIISNNYDQFIRIVLTNHLFQLSSQFSENDLIQKYNEYNLLYLKNQNQMDENYFNELNSQTQHLYLNSQCYNIEEFVKFTQSNYINLILPVPVIHCQDSTGYVFSFNGFKVVYSGDCDPSELLPKYGENSDLLIHESTYHSESDSLLQNSKFHCNMIQALQIAIQMKARFTCLTHFSQRYQINKSEEQDEVILPKDPVLRNYFLQNCFMAQDHLYFDNNSIPLLPSINKIINFNYNFINQ